MCAGTANRVVSAWEGQPGSGRRQRRDVFAASSSSGGTSPYRIHPPRDHRARRAIEGLDVIRIKMASTSKREGNDLSYVTRMGASALVIAAAFAVALAVLVTSSTPAAEAADITVVQSVATVQPGDTAVIRVENARIVRLTIDGENSTSTGSFASGGGQTLACSDSGSCDTDANAEGVNTPDEVTVKLNVDDDSADGFIIVSQKIVLDGSGAVVTTAATNIVISVKTQPKPASLTAKAAATTIDATEGSTSVTANVKNDRSPAVGMNDQRLTFVTTLGTLNCPQSGSGASEINAANNVQVCQILTSDSGTPMANGNAVVTLSGAGREGTAVVTVTHGTLDPATVEVTMFGEAKNLTAEAEQGSVEISGSVFVVLTVTDGAGNPVSMAQPQPAAKDAIVGPDKDANKVTTSQVADDNQAATSPYNVNKDVDGDGAVDKGDIPACGPVEAVEGDSTVDRVVQGVFASTGTNNAGQCVVQVKAPKDDATTTGTDEAATRGVHTLNFALAKLTASAEIEVAGAPADISTDPAEGSYVGLLSETKITVTVTDDEGVLVGATKLRIRRLEGGGLVEGAATGDDGTTTKDGQASVTFTAPSRPGVVTFVIDAGKGTTPYRESLTLNIGTEAPPEPPAPPAPAASVVGQSGLVVVLNADSLEALLGALDCGGEAGTTVTLNDGTYIVGAPSVVNAAFAANVEFPLENAGAYVSCR